MNKFKFVFISFILILFVPFSVFAESVRDSSDYSPYILQSVQYATSDTVNLLTDSQKSYISSNLSLVKSSPVIWLDTSSNIFYFSTSSWVAHWYGYNAIECYAYQLLPDGTLNSDIFIRYGVDPDIKYVFFKSSKMYEENGYVNTPAFDNSYLLDVLSDFKPSYSVTLSSSPSDGGTVSGSGQYPEGSLVSVSASPNSGYRFVGWYDSDNLLISSDLTYQFNIFSSVVLSAHFDTLNQYTLSLSSSPSDGGVVSGGGSYYDGDVVTISAIPNEYFTFVDWSDGDKNSTRQITVNSDISLTANFKYDGLPTPSKPDISDDITNYPDQSDQINSSISIGSTSGGSGGAGSILYTVTDFYNVYTLPRVTWNALIDKQKLECDVSKQPYVCTYQYDDYSDPDDPRNKYLTFEYFTNPYDSNIFLYAYSYSQLSIKGPNIVVSDGASLIKVGTGLPEPFDIKYAYVFGDNVIARDVDSFDYIYTDNVAHVSDNLEQLSSFIQSLPYDTYNLSYQGQVSVSSEVIKSGSYSSIVIGSGDTTLTLYAAISDSTSTVQTINVQVNQLIEQEQNNLTNSELADVNKELDNMNNLIENGNSESQNASTKLDDSYSSFIDVSDHFDSLEQSYLDSLSSQLGDLDISFDLGNNSDFVNSANFVKTNFDKLVDNPFGIIVGFSLAVGICLLMLGKRL